MMIARKCTGNNAAVIAAIREYDNMRFLIDNTPGEIIEVYGNMTAPSMPKLTGLPTARNAQAGEDKLTAQIDSLDMMRERYSAAINFMAWFEPAWLFLPDTERRVLSEFYMSANQKSGATYRLMEDLGYSERHVERMRAKALSHLCLLLFGQR